MPGPVLGISTDVEQAVYLTAPSTVSNGSSPTTWGFTIIPAEFMTPARTVSVVGQFIPPSIDTTEILTYTPSRKVLYS